MGTWGISYPGFYATYSLLSEHPALKASFIHRHVLEISFFDDFHHNGAYLLSYWRATAVVWISKRSTNYQGILVFEFPKIDSDDQFDFFLKDRTVIKSRCVL